METVTESCCLLATRKTSRHELSFGNNRMSQLENITYHFPTNTAPEQAAFEALTALTAPGLSLSSERKKRYPHLNLLGSSNPLPSISFDEAIVVDLSKDNGAKELSISSRLPIGEILRRFQGHIVGVDHLGINVYPSASLGDKIQELLNILSASANLYKYPGGEPWYFVVPATEAEWNSEITNFEDLRIPKFELVVEAKSIVPVIQIDVRTDLSRVETETLLPKPYGIRLPDLDQYFLSVFAEHPWKDVEIRFDFRYFTPHIDEWSSGEWLVTAGERQNKL